MSIQAGPHILVVDDEADVRDLVAEYLSNNEMRVTAVTCGREMLEAFDRESIDLVVLDLRLPGEDGMQLARSLRERASVPIVLLTGRDEEADRVMGLELGADDYVTKPFSPRERRSLRRACHPPALSGPGNASSATTRVAGLPLCRMGAELAHPAAGLAAGAIGRVVEWRVHCALLGALCRAPQRVLDGQINFCRCRACTRRRSLTGR